MPVQVETVQKPHPFIGTGPASALFARLPARDPSRAGCFMLDARGLAVHSMAAPLSPSDGNPCMNEVDRVAEDMQAL